MNRVRKRSLRRDMPQERKMPEGMWKRGNVYYARFRCDGELNRQRLSPDFRTACEMLADLRSAAYRQGQGEISNERALEALRMDWMRSIKQTLKPSTLKRYRQNLDNVFRLLPVRLASQLDFDVIEDFREARLEEGVSPQTVNKDVGALHAMLSWSVERKKIGSNPITGIKPLQTNPKEARALRPEEIDRLLENASSHWRDVWYAYLTTGLRKMELSRLQFSDIDWSSNELTVRAAGAKNKTERRVPIDQELMRIIRRQREEADARQAISRAGVATTDIIRDRVTSKHVFVTTTNTPLGGNLYREFMRACERAGIETRIVDAEGRIVEIIDLHSLRHTFASDLIRNGADPRTVQTLLGHKTLEMTMKIYATVFPEQKREAIAKLSYGEGASPDHDASLVSSRG